MSQVLQNANFTLLIPNNASSVRGKASLAMISYSLSKHHSASVVNKYYLGRYWLYPLFGDIIKINKEYPILCPLEYQ